MWYTVKTSCTWRCVLANAILQAMVLRPLQARLQVIRPCYFCLTQQSVAFQHLCKGSGSVASARRLWKAMLNICAKENVNVQREWIRAKCLLLYIDCSFLDSCMDVFCLLLKSKSFSYDSVVTTAVKICPVQFLFLWLAGKDSSKSSRVLRSVR